MAEKNAVRKVARRCLAVNVAGEIRKLSFKSCVAIRAALDLNLVEVRLFRLRSLRKLVAQTYHTHIHKKNGPELLSADCWQNFKYFFAAQLHAHKYVIAVCGTDITRIRLQ
jgi:hypothetical protein